jgi:kinesin family member 6/9
MVKSNIETFLRIKKNLNSENLTGSNFHTDSNSNSNELNYEIKNKDKNILEVRVPEEMRKGYVNNLKKSYEFKFNEIFDQDTTQEEVFNNIGQKVIKNSLQGYNNTVFCYGQTGSGKTFTMCGSKVWKERGLIPRMLIDIFKQIRKIKNYTYEIFISYLEIYNENAYDLLDRHHSEIDMENWRKIIVYEDNSGNIMLKNLSMIKVENEQQALDLLMTGNFIRHVSSTPMNLASSRSHAIFSCVLEGRELNTEVMRVSKINLVDLAGSERMKSNVYDSNMLNETKYINLSLSFLEQVIIALNEKCTGNRTHIPYRNSLMTTILKDSLGGNCKTILVANISSDEGCIEETISTMRFAARCAKVENEISVNEHMDLNILVSKLNSENEELRK